MTDRSASKDRRAELLDSAEQAARSRGFDGFSYADLAKDVGIRTASIHYHFPSKADLSAALMQRYHENFEEICAQIDARHDTGSARMIALIDRYRQAHGAGERVCLCVAFSISREHLSADVIDRVAGFRRMMRTWIAATYALGQSDGTIASVTDPEAEAPATLAVLEGAQLCARAENNPARFDEAVAVLTGRMRKQRDLTTRQNG